MIDRVQKHGIEIKKKSLYTLAEVLSRLETFELDVTVENASDYDRVHVYVVDPVEKCLFAMLPDDSGVYNHGYEDDWALLLWKNQKTFIVTVAYKGEQKFMTDHQFQLKKKNSITVSLKPTTSKELKNELAKFDRGRRGFNKIEKDLAFQEQFAKERLAHQKLMDEEEKRQKRLAEDEYLTLNLAMKAFPCCFNDAFLAKGKEIFETGCLQCHAVNEQVVGPALRHSLSKHTLDWLIKFTRYPQKVIESGDPYAVNMYKKYKQYMPNHDFLSREDIMSVYIYIEKMSD